MPKGPSGDSRPADVIGNAVLVARIATGEEHVTPPPDNGEEPAAVSMGKRGEAARAAAVVALIDTRAKPAKKRGPYKPRAVKAA